MSVAACNGVAALGVVLFIGLLLLISQWIIQSITEKSTACCNRFCGCPNGEELRSYEGGMGLAVFYGLDERSRWCQRCVNTMLHFRDLRCEVESEAWGKWDKRPDGA